MEYHRLGASQTLRARLLSPQRSFDRCIFNDQKMFFLQNEYIFKKDLHFVCKTNIFSLKIHFSNEIYISYIFIDIFLCKKVFFSKNIFQYDFFFPYKNTFSANNVYFIKHKYFFKKNFF